MEEVILYSQYEDNWSFADESIEDVAQQVLDDTTEEDFSECGYITIYKGVQKPQSFTSYFNVDHLIESINERAYDECGDFAEDYLQKLPQDVIDDLENVVCKWAEKHDLEPIWFMVEDIVEVKVFPVDKEDIDKGFRVEDVSPYTLKDSQK